MFNGNRNVKRIMKNIFKNYVQNLSGYNFVYKTISLGSVKWFQQKMVSTYKFDLFTHNKVKYYLINNLN